MKKYQSVVGIIIITTGLICCQSQNEKLKLKHFYLQGDIEGLSVIASGCKGMLKLGPDTIYYSIGNNIWNLAEEEPVIILAENKNIKYYDTINTIVLNKERFDIDEYRKQNASFEIINGLKAKITWPRKSESGITGIYIDSIGSNRDGPISLNIFGRNLKKKQENKLQTIIRTIKLSNDKFNCNDTIIE